MALRNIVVEGDEILRKHCREVDKITDRTKVLLDDMLETMRMENGVGIAAPQVGVMRRIFITEAEPGKVYTGKVTRLMNFGAFVEILPGKEGLVHISQLSTEHVDKVEDVVSVGDEIVVMVTEIDNKGRINLSRKAVLMNGMKK